MAPYAIVVAIYVRLPSAGWLLWAALTTPANLVAIAVLGYVVHRNGSSFRNYMALRWPRARAIVIGIVCQLALSLAVSAYTLLRTLSVRGTAPNIEVIEAAPFAEIMPWLWLLATVLVKPIGEEIVFRGFMYRGLATRWEPVLAILTISLIFAVAHFDNAMFWHFVCGYLYGVLRWRTDSIWAPLAAHITNNLLVVVFRDFIRIG
ncbi:MAG: CPBP family intramembrane metalloprotease [Deltaproteobacteria bacterium]|nr:CPBP family intramembrane metalloprotease [Deltaproteobacteria bacterium]